MEPDVAVIVVVPCPISETSPWVADVLLIVATAGLEELQTTLDVMSWVLPSLNDPIAENC